jgi:transcriptional regulator with XRE-family HTH domain
MTNKENEQITLKTLRESAELTQPELSRRMNVGIRIIGYWESGTKTPSFDRAIALARELGVSLKTLAKSMRMDVSGVPDDCTHSDQD